MIRKIVSVGLIGLAAGGYYERDMVAEFMNDTNTAREQVIESGVMKAFGVSVDIRCIDQAKMVALFEPGIKGRGIPILNMIWLDGKICQDVEAFVNEPYKQLASEEQVDALETTTHEVAHISLFSSDEGEVECYASQVTYKLAGSLGADAEEAKRIGLAAAKQVRHDQSWLPAEYSITKECQPGGDYDLGDPLRIFP